MITLPSTARRTILFDTLQLDALGNAGANVRALRIDGWDGSPASSGDSVQRLRGPGAWSTPNPQLTPRPLTLSGLVDGVSPDAVEALLQQLRTATSLTDVKITVDGDGVGPRYVHARRTGQVVVENGPRQTLKKWSLGLVADDPRKFADTVPSGTTGLPSQVGGLSFPETWPEVWPAVTVTGVITRTNPGDTVGPVVARVTGPLPDFQIVHVAASGTHVFGMAGLPLGVGEYVDIWMEAEAVLAMGQESRASWISRRGWSGFEPGPNTWGFSSNGSPVGGASMQIFATAAWQ